MTPKELLLVPLATFVILVAAIAAFRLVTGGIVTRGLLTDPHTKQVSPLRIQMFLASMVGALVYASTIAENGTLGAFPAVDPALFVLVGGSHGLLLGGRALGLLVALFG